MGEQMLQGVHVFGLRTFLCNKLLLVHGAWPIGGRGGVTALAWAVPITSNILAFGCDSCEKP
jgi:hypothetical protein